MHKRLDRGDIHNPALRGAERVQECVLDIERNVPVDRHDVVPVPDQRIGIAGETVTPVDAGIVDQDRDRADLTCNLGSHGAAGLTIGNVEREGSRGSAGSTKLGRSRGCRITVYVKQRDPRTLAYVTS